MDDVQAAMRRERDDRARRHRYRRRRFATSAALVDRRPNSAGFVASRRHDGRPFDAARYRLAPGAWSHEHCYSCGATIAPGDEWYEAEPPHQIGLCPACHERLFGADPDGDPPLDQ